MRAVNPWGPICWTWRDVRAVSVISVHPVVRDLLDALQGLVTFKTTNLLIDASDSGVLAYAAFSGWLHDAETAGLIRQNEHRNCLRCIAGAIHH